MALRKRESNKLQQAKTRADAVRSIDKNLDLGEGVSLAAFDLLIKEGEDSLSKYNEELSVVDGLGNIVDDKENVAAQMSVRILAGIGSRFSKNSTQYEKAGGKRTSEIKRKPRVAKPPTPTV